LSDRIAFIGDVHGLLNPLVEVVAQARHDAGAMVFLGDYVNRGPQSSQVLDFLVEIQQDLGPRAHFLLGHHDAAFLAAIDRGRIDSFLRMGGAATLSSYPRQEADGSALPLSQRVPATHVEFLRKLGRSFTGPGCFAAHDPSDGKSLASETFGVFGHRVLPAGVPEIDESRALIDTGCGTLPDGRLTCFLWPDRSWFQAS
jgi:serine/threonine protein phosphatase 1